MLEFIPAYVWAILIIVSAVGLIFRNKLALSIARVIPFFNARTTLVILGVLGIAFGGFGIITGWISGFTGTVASVGGIGAGVPTTIGVLEDCSYKESGDGGGNITNAQDPNSNDLTWYYVDEDIETANDVALVNITCTRAGSTGEDTALQFVSKSSSFPNQISTTDTATYNIIQTTSPKRPSTVFSGEYERKVYLADNGAVTTSSDIEDTYLTYAEAEKQLYLAVQVEIDRASLGKLSNYSSVDVGIYNRDANGNDQLVHTLRIQKLPA